jgi:predicted ATPase
MRSWVRCDCDGVHTPKHVVLTGGPGAGKTAVLELIGHFFCHHVKVLPESAGIVFGGGFPREKRPELQRAAQRAIFFVQRELEATAGVDDPAIVLCDRGTVDGVAYWPGPDDFLNQVGTSLDEQLARYDMVIHLRTPRVDGEYNVDNPLRLETAAEAAVVDARIHAAWSRHPHRVVIEPTQDFLLKVSRAIEILRAEMPMCCEHHVVSLPPPAPTP